VGSDKEVVAARNGRQNPALPALHDVLYRIPVAFQAVLGGAAEPRASGWPQALTPGPLLVAAMAAAAFMQGGFLARGQIAVAALLGAAVVASLPISRRTIVGLELTLATGGLLAGWGVIRGATAGSAASAGRQALMLAALGAVLILCRHLDLPGRCVVLTGLLGIGVIVALIGWMAVAWHLTPWAIPSAGLWRAASTLTYANAASAVLVPIALAATAVLSTRPRSVPLALTVMILLLGAAVTLSRAGTFALVVGIAVLIALRGRTVVAALAAPLAGAAVAFLAVLPSMRTFPPARPGLAVAGLAAGVGLVVVLRLYVKGRIAWALGLAVVAVLVIGATTFRGPEAHLWHHRVNLHSPSRSNAASEALHVFRAHPAAGVGIGNVVITRTDHSGRLHVQRYVHDEYLQTLVEQGIVGVMLLAALFIALGRLLWLSRPRDPDRRALWAGVVAACAAAAVHAGFDFVWHVPAIPLILAALIGLAIRPAVPDSPSTVVRKESV
jgi:hypothetical protein